MNIELRNVVIFDKMSEETTAYRASIYIDGKRAGHCKNDGKGGMTTYYPDDHKDWPLLREAEKYCDAMPPMDMAKYGVHEGGESFKLPMSLSNYLDTLLWDFEIEKQDKKLRKRMLTHLLWGSRHSYVETKWKGWSIEQMMRVNEGRQAISAAISRFKEQMPDGKLLNTNIKTELL